jgi:hypothetical protein
LIRYSGAVVRDLAGMNTIRGPPGASGAMHVEDESPFQA